MEQISYEIRVSTRDIVRFLIGCRDQVASTIQISDVLNVPVYAARDGLLRLKRVGRVDEFMPDHWHLE